MVTTSVRERSPNYPGIDLQQAEEYAKAFYEKHRRTNVPLEVAAKVLGFNTVSGPVKSRFAALKQYGVAEVDKQGNIRLTERGLTLAMSPSYSTERTLALQAAALSPALFDEMYRTKREADDDTLHYFLVRDRRFSPEGATRLITNYRASLRHAKLGAESSDDSPDEGESMFTDSNDGADRSRGRTDDGGNRPAGTVLQFMLTGGKTAQVILSGGAISRRDFAKLIKLLEISAEDVEEPDDEPEPATIQRVAPIGLDRLEWAESSREA